MENPVARGRRSRKDAGNLSTFKLRHGVMNGASNYNSDAIYSMLVVRA